MQKKAGRAARRWRWASAVIAAFEASAGAQEAAPPETALPVVRVRAQRSGEPPSEQTGRYGVGSTQTATRLDLSARETPQSISVVTRSQIEDFGLQNVNDLLATATGVNVERVETDRTYFSVRGFEVTNFQVDGIGLPFATGDQQGDLDTALYDRVEVLRGANGLMSLTGNPAATINFVRKRPTSALQASAGWTLGSWNKKRLDADVAGPLNAAGSVRGRLVVAAEDRDSYLDRYSLRKVVFSGMVEADLGPSTLLTLGHAEQRNRPKGTMWGALPLYFSDGTPTNHDVSRSTAPDWAYWNSSDKQSFAELTQRLADDWQLKATLTRRVLTSDFELFYVYGTPDAGLFGWPSKYTNVERQWIGDVHLKGSFGLGGRRHQAVFGVNSAKSDNRLRSSDDEAGTPVSSDVVFAGTSPRPDFDQGITGQGDFIDRRNSLYAAAQFSLSAPLKLLTGTSVTRATSRGEQYGVPHTFERTKASPFVGLTYDLRGDMTLYASWSSIFNPQFRRVQGGGMLAPLEGRNAEVGVKGEWLDRRLNATLALFRTTQKNLAEAAGFENGYTYYRAVDARSTGFEVDVSGSLAPGWEVNGGYTLLRMKALDGSDTRSYVPRRTLRLTSRIQVPAVPGLKVGAGVSWQDDISRDEGNDIVIRQGSYALLNLMARYEVSRQWALTAQVNNVTDQRYLGSLLWSQSIYGAPRNLQVNLAWKY